MESNWRAGLAQDSRNKIVSRIMDTLQRHTPLSGQDGMSELWKIANRLEEKIFLGASDQHDYLKRISLKMLNLETKAQNAPNGGPLPTSLAGTSQSSVRPSESVGSADSIQQLGQAGGMDQAELVWSKMQTLKEKYLEDMKDLFNMLATKSRHPMPQEQLHKLNHYKAVLHQMMPYLEAAKGNLPKEFAQDKVEAFEKQIVAIMETFGRQRQAPQQSQQQVALGQAQAVQQPQQAPQNLQSDGKSGQIPQINSRL